MLCPEFAVSAEAHKHPIQSILVLYNAHAVCMLLAACVVMSGTYHVPAQTLQVLVRVHTLMAVCVLTVMAC